jgi:hypothetical protein
MKKFFGFLLLLVGLTSGAQDKKEKTLMERSYLLSHTVFGTKDSAVLEDLFAKKLSYGHSSGKVESREEALRAISSNRSVYTDTSVSNMTVMRGDEIAIVRHLFKATETNSEGKVSQLNFTVMLVWVKEKRKWRLQGRQAVRLM